MNPQPEEYFQRRLQKLEAKMNSFSPISSQRERQEQTRQSGFAKLTWHFQRAQIWYQGLSGRDE